MYTMITPESILRMAQCFSNEEEMTEFMDALSDMGEQLCFQAMLIKRMQGGVAISAVQMKQICTLVMFVRHNTELIQQLISKIESKNLTEEQMRKIIDETEKLGE
jgi:hypothetical protein